jgi:hypothetical protein
MFIMIIILIILSCSYVVGVNVLYIRNVDGINVRSLRKYKKKI